MKKNILIVEDEMIIAENMRLMIEEINTDYHTEIATSAEEADKIIHEFNPDIILLDIRLGNGKNGIEFAALLNKSQIPFIYVTSHGDPTTIKSAIATEPLGYLIKPVNKQTLFSQLELSFAKLQPAHYYTFRSGHHDIRLLEKQIVYLKSDNIYTELHTVDTRYIIRKSTKNILEELKISLLQTHRSYFVNPEYVVEANAEVKLSNGQNIPLSRTYKPELLKIIFRK